jgi:hypothetical protein
MVKTICFFALHAKFTKPLSLRIEFSQVQMTHLAMSVVYRCAKISISTHIPPFLFYFGTFSHHVGRMESQLANLVEFVSCRRWLLLNVLSLNHRAAKIAVSERAINGLNERGHWRWPWEPKRRHMHASPLPNANISM